MKRKKCDLYLGLAMIAAILFSGRIGILGILYFFLFSSLICSLWHIEPKASRILAAVLYPPILLSYLLPKNLKHSIQTIWAKNE